MTEEAALSIHSTAVYDGPIARRAGEVIAAAFADLPPTRWLLSNHASATRPRVLRDYFTLQVQWALRSGCGRVEMVVDEAVAVWVRSDPTAPPRPLAGYEELLRRACDGKPERFEALEKAFVQHHPADPVDHLMFLAVRSTSQRSGLGTGLLLHGLARLDKQGREGFLEATTADNVGFYERHGFHGFPPVDGPEHRLQPYLGPDGTTLITPMLRPLARPESS
jgi:ribosomal protein S18 acetylase RimI-like enzyme